MQRPLQTSWISSPTTPKYAELIPVLQKALRRTECTESSIALLEDQLTAVDIQTGAGVAKVVGELWDGSGALWE